MHPVRYGYGFVGVSYFDHIIVFGGTVYPKKYAHGFCFAVFYCGYTLTDFPISIRLTSLALWQSNDCPSASKATLMNMDKYFMWIHYERLHNHNEAKHNKTVCIFLGIYCICQWSRPKWMGKMIFLAALTFVYFLQSFCQIWDEYYLRCLSNLNHGGKSLIKWSPGYQGADQWKQYIIDE